jgi:hypothetical protein
VAQRRLTETEKMFMGRVIVTAKLNGWTVLHIHPLYSRDGRPLTPGGPDGKGYPDLTLFRERVIWAELKVGKNKPTPEQLDWGRRITAAGAECYLWRPEDWTEIVQTLSDRRATLPM